MSELKQNSSVLILFAAFFILYGLEFVIPLVRRKSRHFLSNLLCAGALTLINISFTSLTLLTAGLVEEYNIGLFNQVSLHPALVLVVSIVFLDFWAGYLVHYLLHHYSWLWKLHSVHHSDDFVDVTTTFRQHPAESVIRIFFHLTGMAILGTPIWILLIYLTLSTVHAQFEHANIHISAKIDKMLQYVFVTPNMHKVHHSRYQHETDSNYSNIFSIWDRLFKTYQKHPDYTAIDYGLDYLERHQHFTFVELIKLPFRKIIKRKSEPGNEVR